MFKQYRKFLFLLLTPLLGLSFFSRSHASSPQYINLSLEIIASSGTASFTGIITPSSGTTLFIDNIYRTTQPSQLLTAQSSIDSNYLITGSLISSVGGSLFAYTTTNIPISLENGGDGIKHIFGTMSTPALSGAGVLTFPIVYGLDTTPPPLTYSFQGPSSLSTQQAIAFQRDHVTDAGVGLEYYTIQISQSPLFSAGMSFSTTGNSLTLGAQSLATGVRYRRRGAKDKLGNIVYSVPQQLHIWSSGTNNEGNSISTIGSITPPQPPIHTDQCPQGDNSGNPFDGICTVLIEPPFLAIIDKEHQAPSNIPERISDILDFFTPKKPFGYFFPNYTPPESVTLYEYDTPQATPQHIYVYEKNTITQSLPYAAVISSLDIQVSSYLYSRYLSGYPFCSLRGGYCSEEPVCQSWGVCSDTLWCEDL